MSIDNLALDAVALLSVTGAAKLMFATGWAPWHSFKGTKREAQVECARLIASVGQGSYVERSQDDRG
jgi:hypothetical protein